MHVFTRDRCEVARFTREVYSLRPKMSIVLAFKFCHTKTVVLACNEIYLIKAIPSTNKILIKLWKSEAISMLYKGDFDQTAEIGGHQGSQSPKGPIKEYLINNHISTHFIFLLELLK